MYPKKDPLLVKKPIRSLSDGDSLMRALERKRMKRIKRILCGLVLVFAIGAGYAQSPHGKELKMSCDACHTADSWTISKDLDTCGNSTTRV